MKFVVDDCRRYGLTTAKAIQCRYFDGNRTATDNFLKKFRPNTESITLAGGQVAYRLTRSAARRLDVSQSVTPPTPERLRQLLGVFCYCALASPRRHLITRPELKREFPYLCHEQIKTDRYYVAINGDKEPERLVYLIVDVGNSARGMIKKCKEEIVRRTHKIPAIHQLVFRDHRVGIAIITTTQERAMDIRDHYERDRPISPFWTHVPLVVKPEPEYAALIPDSSTSAAP